MNLIATDVQQADQETIAFTKPEIANPYVNTSDQDLNFLGKSVYWNRQFARYVLDDGSYLFLAEHQYFTCTKNDLEQVQAYLTQGHSLIGFQQELQLVYLTTLFKNAGVLVTQEEHGYYLPNFRNKMTKIIGETCEAVFLTHGYEKQYLPLFDRVMPSESAMVLVFVDDYLDPRLETILAELKEAKKACALIRMSGEQVMLGPIFNPMNQEGTSYEGMVESLWRNQPVRKWMQQRCVDVVSFPTKCIKDSIDRHWLIVIQSFQQLIHQKAAADILTIDLAVGEVQNHYVIRSSSYQHYINQNEKNRLQQVINVFEVDEKITHQDGGYRTTDPATTFDQLQKCTGMLTGLIHPVQLRSDAAEALSVFSSGFYKPPIYRKQLDTQGFIQYTLGKGNTEEQSKMSALAEAVERFSAVYDGTQPHVYGKTSELDARAILPDELKKYSAQQLKQFGDPVTDKQAIVPLPPGTPLHWCETYAPLSQEKVYVPFTYCHSDTPFKDEEYVRFDSNGCSAGNTLGEAILQGFLELVERDAAAIWWYNKVPRPAVEFNDLAPELLQKVHDTLDAEWDYWALDLTHDFEIPVIAAIGQNKRTREYRLGFGAHLDVTIATSRALTELYQLIVVAKSHSTVFSFDRIGEEPYLHPSQEAPRRFLDFNLPMADSIKASLEYCLNRISHLGLEVCIADLSRPQIPLHVVKVIIPGLNFIWSELANPRLYELPVKLGWQKQTKSESELNQLKLFL